ncbi:MAG: YabP/YqfC family sporulation protein [Oscillospiraceae bacterium]|nr:YabP/YqfC family sporulation protein [Oscillospiraceae bacterium]
MSVINRKRPVTDKLGLPAQLLPREPKLTVCGGEVCIENHGGLQCYTRECIEVRGRNGFLRINGDGLMLAAMTTTEIVVRGLVVSVELC